MRDTRPVYSSAVSNSLPSVSKGITNTEVTFSNSPRCVVTEDILAIVCVNLVMTDNGNQKTIHQTMSGLPLRHLMNHMMAMVGGLQTQRRWLIGKCGTRVQNATQQI